MNNEHKGQSLNSGQNINQQDDEKSEYNKNEENLNNAN